jgi:acyl-CoA synthetase (AMP-forming)/AMP-acid ligase II
MKTVAEMLRWRARLDPDGTALVFGKRTTTYRELDRRSNQVAQALMTAGVRPGHRVCVLDKGHDEFFEVIFGIAKAGGVYTPVNWRLAPPEIALVLDDAETPLVFVGTDFAEALSSIEDTLATVRSVVCWGGGKKHWSDYETFRNGGDDGDPCADGSVDATAWQLYTSGTTGHPKGAELTHANLCDTASLGAVGFGAGRPGDVALICMPLYHIGGSGYALALFYSGAKLVITREPDPGTILSLIEAERVTHAFLVPALMNFLLQHPACRATDFSSLRSLLYGASPIPGDLLAACIETFGCDLIQAYGLTETTGAVVLLPAKEHVPGNPRLRSCGLPIYGTDLRIARADGSECPPGEVGEILVRGPMVMKGYYNRPEATAEALRDGWFHSGDAGYRDEDGYVYIHDRVKDMIVSGGENVYPAEVESILFAHPDVADVAIIGVPDDRWGETVKAVVVRTPGSRVGEGELIEYCRGKIAGFKRPRSIDFVDALPRNPTGKILKRELREPYWTGRDRRVN